ncbi:fructose-6-phosphate aldolase [Enterococcus alishanensis]|uniref:Fructose-6-phosphate aldolase n=1 Tax=Enterococcus alishanensis TaxID=1303817 RepID=A0ABS6TCF8_9ENTE|nr:fructose-6-phosphate aldolase [Enterococcus alishanensis]MBV7390604.1 fructose-6-phosphate aldolase [Enterococcus alishanensis]
MKFLLDTANLEDIQQYNQTLPIAGVTSNPSIIKKEGKIDFFNHMKKIREIIGTDKTLHVQVIAEDYEGMIKDAEAILAKIDQQVYIKIPTTEAGIQAMKELKRRGINVTATAIYTKMQAYLAIAAGADYLAPYFNRMENLNIDPREAIFEMAEEISRTNSKSKILAASFKNVGQVTAALESGAQAATMGPDILAAAFAMPSINQAVSDFSKDWSSIFGENVTIADL